jgi:structural maintenance of chromosome 4
LSEASTWIQNHSEEIETHTTKLANLEKSLSAEEKELDSVRDSLKVKTQGFTNEIEAKQKSLEPWTSQINEKQAAMALVQSELDLIREKEVAGVKALEEVVGKVAKLEGDRRGKEGELKESRRELGAVERGVGEVGREVKAAQQKAAKVYEALSQSRAKADEANASLSASQTQGQVLTSLTRLRDSGRITGFHVNPQNFWI